MPAVDSPVAEVSAIFVRADGPYPQLVPDYWDEARDARGYVGPRPVVAHPPCKRWGRFWAADGSTEPGQDGGLFAFALGVVRQWGGVLEHPADTKAWAHFGINKPERGSWRRVRGGWTTCVDQRNYGHRGRKRTWLFYVGAKPPPDLDWSDPEPPEAYLSQPGRCKRGIPRPHCSCRRCKELLGDAWVGRPPFKRMTAKENETTPIAFAHLLIQLAAGSCRN